MGVAESRTAPAEELPGQGGAVRCLVDLNPLPEELLVLVLSWVPGRTLVRRGRLVCRRWRALIDAPTLWKLKWAREPSPSGRDLLQTALRVARRTPRVEWGRLGVLKPFGRNLIRNPCGTGEGRRGGGAAALRGGCPWGCPRRFWVPAWGSEQRRGAAPCLPWLSAERLLLPRPAAASCLTLGVVPAERLLHWETQQGGNGWAVEENLDLVARAEAQTCFASSFQ